MPGEEGTWGEAIAPLARKLRVAAALPGFDTRWNSAGARAFLQILEAMAHKLDVVATARDRIVKLERMRKTSPGPLSRLFRIPAANATGRAPGPSRDHGAGRAGS